MSAVFTLPDLGEGLTEAEIVAWRVAVGDEVETDQVVVEVETAKAAVEVPCPHAGRVVALHAEPGEVLPVGRPLITIEPVAGATGRGQEPAEPAAHATYREEERAGSGNVLIGYGTGAGGGTRRRRRLGRPQVSQNGASVAPRESAPVAARQAVRVISPVVRRLALERGVDLHTLTPTGPGGVIRRRDVEAAAAAAPHGVGHGGAGRDGVGRDGVGRDGAGPGEERIPLRGLRRAVAEKVTRSRREIPDVTIWVDVDATGLLEARRALQAAYPDHRISVLALVARFCLAGLRRYPELNARVDGDDIVRSRAVHLGVAAQTDRGLLVPVVHDAHTMTTVELADALAETTAQARAGTLSPERLTGGTFTLNNYGVFGVDGSTPILNHPEAALVGLGRIVDKPWAVDGRLEVRTVTQVSLTFDHRVCDGGVAGGFLRYVADCIESPTVLLGGV